MKVKIKGMEFQTLTHAYQHFGVRKQGINQFKKSRQFSSADEMLTEYLHYRLARQISNREQEDKVRKTLSFMGKMYNSIKDITKEYNIPYQQFINKASKKEDKLKFLAFVIDNPLPGRRIAAVKSADFKQNVVSIVFGNKNLLSKFRHANNFSMIRMPSTNFTG